MKDKDWKMLTDSISTRNCILVLGPDIARGKVNGEVKPLTEILAQRIADEMKSEPTLSDRKDLPYIAQKYCNFESTRDMQMATASFYEESQFQPSELHKDLAALPFYFIVNATPDYLFVEALNQLGKEFTVDWYDFRGRKKDMVKWDSRDKPLIYYLYGSTKGYESLMISENDLLEFLVAVISNEPPIPSNISSEFRDKDKCFLFIGFGFKNWYLRILLYVLQGGKEKSKKNSRSFALEESIPENDPDFEHTCIFFRDEHKIHFADMAVDEFVKELRQRYEAEKPPESGLHSQKNELSEDAPTVFICHASEDKDSAKALYERLQEGDVKPWIDVEEIRGGDRWDKLLEKTIKEIDYFVVLQSPAMEKRTVGYVYKEIHLAIARQLEFKFGISFIIPVKIGDCELLEELEHIQSIDLNDKMNIEQLFKVIKRDQQRRKK